VQKRRPTPGSAGEEQLVFGGAALTPSSAAYRRVCFSSRAKQAEKLAGLRWLVAILLLAAGALVVSAQAPAQNHPQPPSPSAKHKYLMSESIDLGTLETAAEDNTSQAAAQNAQGQIYVIQRIEFIGNRRVRNDTLKARIFSREGDAYNKETLRRDFQALWNTQFFEDVKLRVEDSPDRANSKIIIFEVKERPVIRRIRYDGIHSISESDILDRFKERKVGLTVESQFDPTKIKKAEVVLQELLGEHGRQFAKVTPQYERIASSNAVILIFKIDEGPKVKVGRIKFTGNHAFSDRKLVRSMRNDRPYGIPLYFTFIPVMSKTYDHDKLIEDLKSAFVASIRTTAISAFSSRRTAPSSKTSTRATIASAFRSFSASPTAKRSSSPFPSKKASATRCAR
jgi:outer membrane protein assembly factor BamA